MKGHFRQRQYSSCIYRTVVAHNVFCECRSPMSVGELDQYTFEPVNDLVSLRSAFTYLPLDYLKMGRSTSSCFPAPETSRYLHPI